MTVALQVAAAFKRVTFPLFLCWGTEEEAALPLDQLLSLCPLCSKQYRDVTLASKDVCSWMSI